MGVLIYRRLIFSFTDKVYNAYAKSAKAIPQTVDIGLGAKGHWIGDENAKNVLIWYHGNIQAPLLQTSMFPHTNVIQEADFVFLPTWATSNSGKI